MLTALGGGAASFGYEPCLGSGRETTACAGARSLIQSLKPFLDEAAAGALDSGEANTQSRDDLCVGRAPAGVQQEARVTWRLTRLYRFKDQPSNLL